MPDHKQVYNHEALNYQRLIAREDYQNNLLPAIRAIVHPQGLDVVDLGSGTGRLACLLAPHARSIFAFDLSPHMLEMASLQLKSQGFNNWLPAAADHRYLPLAAGSIDLVISGWSFCYLAVWAEENWEAALTEGLKETDRLLREKGTMIIIETQGTGVTTPEPPEKLGDYFSYLASRGFEHTWLRTDYQFADLEEALELTQFFFGKEMLDKIGSEAQPILPECTGIWWKGISPISGRIYENSANQK
jgi:ubiquinone/menaquinone biosynthesis C-methylase UbiE